MATNTRIEEWELDFDGENNVSAISIVTKGAIGVDFKFSKQEPTEFDADQVKNKYYMAAFMKLQEESYTFDVPEERFLPLREKKLVVGPVLIPNKIIYQRQDNEDVYGYFSEESVRNAAQNFLRKGRTKEFNVQHNDEAKLNSVSLVESWIVDDPESDKARFYGYNLPEGSWMGIIRIEDLDFYSEFIQSNALNGFSVETLVQPRVIMSEGNRD